MQQTTHDTTIASGASLSAAVVLGPHRAVAIVMPTDWTAASLTFEVSVDGGTTYKPLYDVYGQEYTVPAGAARTILLPPSDFASFNALKVRSGSAGTPVNQGADRTLQVASVFL